MASTNLLQFNPAQMNQENDASYAADAMRTGGAPVGSAFPSPLANKLFYQLSTFVAAFGAMLAAKGYDTSDADIAALQAVLANVKTAADFRDPLRVISYAATPAFDASVADGFQMQLTGNVTGPTLTGQTAGQLVTFAFQQDATGGRTVAWPSGVVFGPPVNAAPNAWTVIQFFVGADLQLRVSDVATPSQFDLTSTRAFNTSYTNTAPRAIWVSVSSLTTGGVGQDTFLKARVTSPAGTTTLVAANSCTNSAGDAGVIFLVLPGYTYEVDMTYIGSVPIVQSWVEWW